jgi:phosphoserine phosphatase
MNRDACDCCHDAAPDTAIAAVRSHKGPVLIDLDGTLYFGNSTEDFIDTARPGLLALLLLRALDLFRPWRWTGGEATRDVWRVRLVSILFPWTSRRWNARVDELARNFTNRTLISAINGRDTPPIIATVGFQPIVEPLVAALGLSEATVVAARLDHFEDRRGGKLNLALNALGEDTVRQGLVITDSPQDLPLLEACAHPLRTVWPQARYRPALSNIYLPGQYLTQVKRPGERYILRGILQEDFAYWVLASIALAPVPALHVAGLLMLLISFWAVYERGYVENDLVASVYEAEPKLTAAFDRVPVATPALQPWLWAVACGGAGIALLRWPGPASVADCARWGGVLLLTYLWFRLYNHCDKSTRIWMYSGLQLSRSTAFAAIVPMTVAGSLAIGAHTLARWIPYYVYRLGDGAWPEAPLYLSRLLFLIVLAAVVAIASGVQALGNWTMAAVFAWTVYRARHELKAMLAAAHRVDRPSPSP